MHEHVRRLQIPDMGTIYFNVQDYTLTISEAFRHTYTFDKDGRLISCFHEGINYKRSLDNTIMMKHNRDGPHKTRTILSQSEAQTVIVHALSRVSLLRPFLHSAGHDDIVAWLDTIALWDVEQLAAEYHRFHAIYDSVGILPPDQYLSIVLQATQGCSWNTCTFCTLYQGKPFTIKPPPLFRTHVQQVKAFLGKSIGLRKSIFLADANALIIPQKRLLELLHIVHEEFPIGTSRPTDNYVIQGIYAFLDIFGAERKTQQHYRELYDAQVRRIYIGLESGDSDVFQLLNKPGSPADCIEAVQMIKSAGIHVGVILLAGAGGDRLAEQHIRHSVEAITRMSLDKDDILYVSPLVLSGQEPYVQKAQAQGILLLSKEETMDQAATLKKALKHATAGKPRVTLYSVEEFLY